MFELLFYENNRGVSEIVDYLDELKRRSENNKDVAVRRRKILSYLAALQDRGTLLGKPYVKHIDEDIWELRPLDNRIFFFYWKDNTIILLHYYIKKTDKTPRREIERAKRERNEWIERNSK